jgi:D-glycero-D-manno-heptose 1,7-bisphosphate phosphatase
MGIDAEMSGIPAVFLDRDGVLNRAVLRDGKPHPPETAEQMEIMEGARPQLEALRTAGFRLICVTNQPDVARGRQTRERVEAINAVLRAELPLDDLRVCWHDMADSCDCRKPNPGLLTQAARDHDIDLARSVIIGDRWSDIEAGRRAGCLTVLVGSGYGESPLGSPPDATVQSLKDAVMWILERHRKGEPSA